MRALMSESDTIKVSAEILSKTVYTDSFTEDGEEDNYDIYVLSSSDDKKFSMVRKTITARDILKIGLKLPER